MKLKIYKKKKKNRESKIYEPVLDLHVRLWGDNDLHYTTQYNWMFVKINQLNITAFALFTF